MTTLLVLYRRPEGGDEALATFDRRYRDEHLPLVAETPGLRATRVWRVGEALGGETDLVLVAAMDFDDRAALDAASLRPDARRRPDPARDRAGPGDVPRRRGRARTCSAARRPGARCAHGVRRSPAWILSRTEDRRDRAAPPERRSRRPPSSAPLPAPAGGPVDGVALVMIDRPEVLNALDFALIDELADALEALDARPGLPGDRPDRRRRLGRSPPARTSRSSRARRRPRLTVDDRLPRAGSGSSDPEADHRRRARLRARRRLRAGDALRHDRRRRGRPVRAARDQARGDARRGRDAAADAGDRQGEGDGADPDRPEHGRARGGGARARDRGRPGGGDASPRRSSWPAGSRRCRRSR